MKTRLMSTMICIITVLSLFGCSSKTDYSDDAVVIHEQESSAEHPNVQAAMDNESKDTDNENETGTVQQVSDSDNSETNEQVGVKNENTEIDTNEVTVQTDNEDQPLQQNDNSNSGDQLNDSADELEVEPDGTMAEVSTQTSDTFVGRILSSDHIEGLKELPSIITIEDNFYLHKVEVIKTYRSTFVKEKTTVYVLHYANPDSKRFSNHFEVGQTYLLTVFPQIYNGGNILVDHNLLNAHISSDGKLTPNSYYSKVRLGDISTVDEFEKDPVVQKEMSLPCFYFRHKIIVPVIPDGENQTDSTQASTKIVKFKQKNFETIATEDEIKEVIEAVQDTTIVNEKNEKLFYNNSSIK